MKRSASFLLALIMLFSLAACGEGGLNLNPKDKTDTKEGYIGDTLSTAWFDFVVNDAYSCGEYHGYTPAAGKKLVVATITVKSTFKESVDMWGDDFIILWNTGENADAEPALPAGISDDQFPDEYTLRINATECGVVIYEVPEEYKDFAIWFPEVYEDGTEEGGEGDNFFVYFTPEER